MPNSFAQTAELTCPHCHRAFTTNVWLIVDVTERPDLLERVQAATLHDLPCPYCAKIHSVNAPLLVLRPTQKPPLIFVPADGAVAEQNQQAVDQLVALLRQNMGGTWQEAWIDESETLQWDSAQPAFVEKTGSSSNAGTQSPSPSLPAILQELSQPAGISDMPRRVQLCQAALTQIDRAQNPPLWAALQGELGNSLLQNPQDSRSENLERAIACYEQALQVMTRQAMVVEWATITNNLATAYAARIRGERVENLERAIQLNEQALQVMTHQAMPVEWARTTNNLAIAYADRIRGERVENLERAIQLYEQALQVRTHQAMPVEWAETTNNLATAYADRIRGERAENLERAIQLNEQALQVMTRETMPVEWAKTTNNLAAAYADRIRGERAENLERAIALNEQALQVRTRPAMPVEWAETTNNLAAAYADRIRGERAENLERAIALNEQALQVRTHQAMPVEWAETTNNLASAYADRLRGERAENLERAIALNEQALQVMTRQAMPVEWARTTMNLASAYADRLRGERAENLERAIAAYEQALQVQTRPAMPVEWAQITTNLANAYADRLRGERAENLERAIAAYEQALQEITRPAMPVEWATTTNNLAVAYADRLRGERAENLERAIQLNEQALQVRTRPAMPVEWATTTSNLATAYHARLRGERAENLERAIELNKQALQVYTQAAFPDDHRRVQQRLGDLYFGQARWPAAAAAFQQALAAGELLYAVAATPEARQSELGKVRGIPAQRAYALARANDAMPAAWRDAVLVLEQNRARWLNESLALNAEKPAAVADALWQRFVDLGQQIQELQAESRLPEETPAKRAYLALTELLRTAYEQLDETVAQIRGIAPDFMPQPSFAEIQAAAQASPLVYLLTTSAGGLALIVLADKVTPVWLDGFTDANLNHLLVKRDGEKVTGGYLPGQFANTQALRAGLDEVLPVVGKWIMGPLAAALRDLIIPSGEKVKSITLIPTGLLGLLPLHAARYEVNGQTVCFLDEFTVTYAPSARALAVAQQRPVTAQRRLLALGNPLGPKTDPAWFTDWLANEVSQHFQAEPPFVGTQASGQAFRNALTQQMPQHLLFGCHGTFDLDHPLESGLALADGDLTLAELLNEVRLDGCDLVTLCACQTAITDFRNVPDEAIGLPAAILQAGARRVVGTLWSVQALPTVLLLRHFYEQVANHVEPVYALRVAIQWLRTLPQKAVLSAQRDILAYVFSLDPNDVNLPQPTTDDASCPFADPVYWSAFTYTGAV